MNMRRLALAVFALLLFATVLVLFLWRLEDHDLERRGSVPFSFTAGDNRLSGMAWLPVGDPIAVVVLVHGDGPQDRTSGGYAPPLVNVLLDGGIAVASWDKPGVGASSGNWLDQTMTDRADEARAALNALAIMVPGDVPRGAIGFSQAGWVLPKLSAKDTDFIVLIGPAVSWEQQGRFYHRLELAGESEARIVQALAHDAEQNERLFGANARFDAVTSDGMSRDRWEFVRRNRMADATRDLSTLDVPTLALWGQNDLNVDAVTDAAIYRTLLLERHPANRIMVIPDATHGLLKAEPYNYQLVSQWPLWAQARFLIEGRFAYASSALDAITGFIEQAAVAGHGHAHGAAPNRK